MKYEFCTRLKSMTDEAVSLTVMWNIKISARNTARGLENSLQFSPGLYISSEGCFMFSSLSFFFVSFYKPQKPKLNSGLMIMS